MLDAEPIRICADRLSNAHAMTVRDYPQSEPPTSGDNPVDYRDRVWVACRARNVSTGPAVHPAGGQEAHPHPGSATDLPRSALSTLSTTVTTTARCSSQRTKTRNQAVHFSAGRARPPRGEALP